MVTHSTKILFYVWKPEIGGYSITDTKNVAPIHWIIGETLSRLITKDNDALSGLQLLRLKIGSSEITAHKRLTDIKVTIHTYKNN